MLRPGLIVSTAWGEVLLQGRNACNRAQWWGFPFIIDKHGRGKFDRRHMWVGFAKDIFAIKTAEGFRPVLPGILETTQL